MGQGHTPRSAPGRWRLLVTGPADGPQNMAIDEALLGRAQSSGECVFRLYEWARPTLSLGRNQAARGHYDLERARSLGIDFVRRPTGGRAVLHHRELTYSVTAPSPGDETLVAAYERINTLLVKALATLGVPVRAADPSRRAAGPTAAPCFAEPARGELTYEGRKLVGSAQWRDRGALLQHGSILLDDDQSSIVGLMREATDAPPAPATLRDALGREPVMAEVSDALWSAVRALADPLATTLEPDPTLFREAELIAARYRDDAWTWRR